MPERLALMLGSGFSTLVDGLPGRRAKTPWGEPSAPLCERRFGNTAAWLLPRHGEAHDIPPHAINYRANVAALADAGVTGIIALNTVGAVTSICTGGDIGVPEQLIDYTWGRAHTFFDGGGDDVTHIDFTQPFDADLRRRLLEAAAAADVDCYDGGVYAVTQGPRLETAAEVERLARDGADYVGMTAMPEAALAAEARIPYACLALVVNPAAGRGDTPIHDDVGRYSAQARERAMRVIDALFGAAR
ncbi:MAG: S-methyl-5'-thioinosine phosphorylase [Woeseiaceae bacterium]|nr:S-methyl-5'-thioinosine phosphorylase [Woeseiaceae bacterium]